jgi:hypothetical protein
VEKGNVPSLRETSSSLDAEMTPKTKQEKIGKRCLQIVPYARLN